MIRFLIFTLMVLLIFTPVSKAVAFKLNQESRSLSPADPTMAALAIVAAGYRLTLNPKNGEIVKAINGRCICDETGSDPHTSYKQIYVLVRDLADSAETKVWLDDSGRFSFATKTQHHYAVQAINESSKLISGVVETGDAAELDIDLRQ